MGLRPPRTNNVEVLHDSPGIVSLVRDPTQAFLTAPRTKAFEETQVSKAIYGTGWEGTILVKAKTNGTFEISSDSQD